MVSRAGDAVRGGGRVGWWNALVAVCFAAVLVATRPAGGGVDLTSSYLGCRLFVEGETAHLYSQDAVSYQLVTDPVWARAAEGRGFAPGMALPPYVQTPLWGYGLQPLCRGLRWPAFNALLAVVLAGCFGALVWGVARFWAPGLFGPWRLAGVCAVLYAMEPLRYSMALTQTHVLFLFLALAAVVLAERGRPGWAGALLAVAAAVKITPGLLVVYWAMTRRWRAAGSFAAVSAGLLGATVALTGRAAVAAWLASMTRVSGMLLVAWNNQSLAAWALGRRYPVEELWTWHIFALPAGVKAVSLGLLVASAVAGGWMDWRLRARGAPPYGAVLTLVGATLFTPIAWSHYFVVLIVPAMLLVEEHRRRRGWGLVALAGGIAGLNVYGFLVLHGPRLGLALPPVVRVQFYAGVLGLVGLGVLGWRRGMERRGSGGGPGAPEGGGRDLGISGGGGWRVRGRGLRLGER